MFEQSRSLTIAICVLFVAALSGCQGNTSSSPSKSWNITAAADNKLKLWNTSHVHGSTCENHGASSYISTPYNKVIRGYKYPHRAGGGSQFIERLVRKLNWAAVDIADSRNLADQILNAASRDAFTTLDFEGPGGASPSFHVSVIVKSVAHAVAYLRRNGALSEAEMNSIGAWTAQLLRLAPQRGGSLDHKASVLAARLMWSAAVGDAAGFGKAQEGLYGLLNKLKNKPYFISSMRSNNEVMHHMIYAAYILKLNGIDIFDRKFGSHTLNDAVAYHARAVIENGSKKTRTVNDPTDKPRSILRSHGFGTHIAWVPVYLAGVPSGSASEAVRALDNLLRRTDGRPYWGMQIGVHTGCLFGGALRA